VLESLAGLRATVGEYVSRFFGFVSTQIFSAAKAAKLMESMMLCGKEEWQKTIEIRQKTTSSARQCGSAVMA